MASCVKYFLLLLIVASVNTTYPPSRTGGSQLVDIIVPKLIFRDFEYEPTDDGYRFRYVLADGSAREEYGIVAEDDPLLKGVNSGGDVGGGPGARGRGGGLKNRKLSPKSLQSLAG